MGKKILNLKDIPQFIGDGNYSIDVSFADIPKNIERYIEDYDLILNPDFQRGHVWTPDQEREYVEFVLRGGRTSRDFYFNHPGWMGNFKGEFVCVDGKQRIKAIQRFLNDEIAVFGQRYSDYGEKTRVLSHDMIVHVNNLQTRAEVLQWYIEMNTGGTPHSEQEIDRVRSLLEDELSQRMPLSMDMGM